LPLNLLFDFRIGIDGVAATTAHDFLSPLHHAFGALAQLSRLLIQSGKTLGTSLMKIFPRFVLRARRN
jgi:hypothetical protein